MHPRIQRWTSTAVLFFSFAVSQTQAGPINPRYIPPDAKWIVHVDMDTFARSKLWSFLFININFDLFSGNKSLNVGVGATTQSVADLGRKKIQAFADALGMKLPEDVHAITFVGKSFDGTGAVLFVTATMDHDRLIGLAKLNPEYTSMIHDGVEISTWKSDDASGAFLADDVLVLAQTPADIERVIDAVHAHKDNAPIGLLAGGKSLTTDGASVMIYAAVQGLAELQQQEELSPILTPVTRARAALSEQDDDLMLTAVLDVKTAESARQVRGALEGIKALALLAEGASTQAKTLITLAQRATSTVDDTTVVIHWPVAMSVVQNMVTEAMQPKPRHHATTRATTRGAEQK